MVSLRCLMLFALVAGCGDDGAAPPDAAAIDAPAADAEMLPADAAQPECQWGGAPGMCLTTAACSAMPDHTSKAAAACGSGLQCCIRTPNVADNPPTPAGYKLMMQSEVTPEMTQWAIMILNDPITYPMFSTTTRVFGSLMVLARVEWHPPDFQNSIVHRGVTLYEPI
jgi:hypothetical protein